jgi:ABC-2 type transport system ATP-binding protein
MWGRKIKALRSLDLSVERGSEFGVVGPNGAGKTTLMKILTGAVRPTAGNCSILGYAAGTREANAHIGYLPEVCASPNHLTAEQLLRFHGDLAGLDRRTLHQRVGEVLERVGLHQWHNVPLSKYSKGMTQRAGIAQAILHQPDLLILDEPTDGLDPAARVLVLDLLRSLHRSGVTLFWNSHLLDELQSICDEVAILHRGELVRRERMSTLAESGFVLVLTSTTVELLALLSQRGRVLSAEDGTVRLGFETRVDVDWALELMRLDGGGRIESLAPAGKSLAEVFLSATGRKEAA